MNTSQQSGFTTLELVGVMVLLALAGIGAYAGFTAIRDRGETISLVRAAVSLNTSTAGFHAEGGRPPYKDGGYSREIDAPEFLLLLQTPVDAASQKAGFGAFPVVDYRWVLEPVSADELGERLVVTFDGKARQPVWRVVSEGDGFRLKKDSDRLEPGTADWTALVDEAAAHSQVGGRKSKWIWEYDDTPNGATVPVRPPAPTTTPKYEATDAVLSITGPKSITSAGANYYWTGVSSLPGNLTITVQGSRTWANGATSVVSPKRSFVPGDHLEFDVTISRAEGGVLASIHVVVDIPPVPAVAIDGPDVVTTSEPVTWSASSSQPASPIAIRVPDVDEAAAYEATAVSATHQAWPPGTKIDNFKIVASALNQSGLDVVTKLVKIDIPLPPPDPTEDPDPEVDPTEVACSWTVSVDGDGDVSSLMLSGAGGSMSDSSGAHSHTFKKALGAGTYTITASAVVDGLDVPASVNGGGSTLTLTVAP